MSAHGHIGRGVGLLLLGLMLLMAGRGFAADEKFDVLKSGTDEYQNVTVTTKATNFVCILHSRGIATLKVADLPDEVLVQLGYKTAAQKKEEQGGVLSPKAQAQASAKVNQILARLGLPEVAQLRQMGREKLAGSSISTMAPRTLLLVVLGIALFIHLFFSYCAKLICEKTGNQPGPLVWLPVLQLIPLLRAASMSGAWFFAFFLPVLNLVASILWCVKITKARAKSGWVALLLLLPFTGPFAFLYLAFSGKPAPKEEPRRPQNLTLQTA